MEHKCETIGKYLSPLFRALVARELVLTHQLTQTQASEILGMTQAAVSQYIHSKRAIKRTEKFADLLPKIQEMARQTAQRLVNKQTTWREVTLNFCNLCSIMLEDNENKSADNYSI